MTGRKLYLCGQFKEMTESGVVWDFQGIFSTREKAIAACRRDNYFIYPVGLDEELEDFTIRPLRIEYPLQDQN